MRLHIITYILFAAVKLIMQFFSLAFHLFHIVVVNRADFLLVQNPPALPTLTIVWLVTRLRFGKCKVVIDWHNYGYTLLTLGHGNTQGGKIKRLVRWSAQTIYKLIEFGFGRLGDAHLCVSQAMKQDLIDRINIDPVVMHDQPPEIFKQITLDEKHELFKRVFGGQDSTLFTINENGSIELRQDRPALIISSTSWTPDEDFGILLDAIKQIDGQLGVPVRFVITGKGPQREMYEELIKKLPLKNCTVQTMFLAAEDYPKLLACGDIGVCLHYSSSGLDLPMKIVDMFGSCLPVCAIRYKTLPELVKHEKNGLIFNNSKELGQDILTLLKDFPKKSQLGNMQQHLRDNFMKQRWDDEWQSVRPIFMNTNNARIYWPIFALAAFIATISIIVKLIQK